MQVITAYISVVLIWATTPLAIQWSSESVGFLFGISSRMFLGAILALIIIVLFGKRLALHRKALQTYAAAGLGIFTAMLTVYWSAQFIPSGWISIIYGVTPIITGLFAMKLLGERGLTLFRTLAIIMSIIGLYIMFETGLQFGPNTAYGIIGVMASSMFYSLSMVMVKKIDADIDTYSTVTGGLLVSAILYIGVWSGSGTEIPADIPFRAGAAIFYLATVASLLGFFLFYFVLKRVEATRTSLITLITPICALMLGHFVNDETVTSEIIIGCAMILSGLLLFEFEGAIRRIKIID
jgi:drug/metabolite transporter (DMT)-like permease